MTVNNEVHLEVGEDGVAVLTVDRPSRLNALDWAAMEQFHARILEARDDKRIRALIITGAGDRAFCAGGDQSVRDAGGYQGTRARSDLGLDIEELHVVIRDIPKPVIAAETARFGQVGPRVGSVDPGFGTAYLARVVGEKKAREIWYLCRQYSAADALAMGLVNAVVPADRLMEEARSWAREMLAFSPTALKLAKASFNADSDHIKGIGGLGMSAVALYYGTEEALEGKNAFLERRKPDFGRFRR